MEVAAACSCVLFESHGVFGSDFAKASKRKK
jgi:hypothetical protein